MTHEWKDWRINEITQNWMEWHMKEWTHSSLDDARMNGLTHEWMNA